MPTEIEKEWAAVEEEEVVLKAEDRDSLEKQLRQTGFDIEDIEILALPKSHSTMFV